MIFMYSGTSIQQYNDIFSLPQVINMEKNLDIAKPRYSERTFPVC